MNEKFFSLPEEKQERILNAGFQVFSENSYKKSPVSEIAEAAGISKALLFFYFRNKKELYLFLWQKAGEITQEYLAAHRCYEPGDLFEAMSRGAEAKFEMMEKYPHMSAFAIKAFYEKDESVCAEIQQSYQALLKEKTTGTLAGVDPDDFVPGLDLAMMYRDMYWATEGYVWECLQRNEMNTERMKADFRKMISFWKSIYLRKEEKTT